MQPKGKTSTAIGPRPGSGGGQTNYHMKQFDSGNAYTPKAVNYLDQSFFIEKTWL